MSGRLVIPRRGEDGSLPLAMLATIVVAGLISVVLARVTAGEGAVRFDRDFAESLQVADIGVNRGLFALNEGQVPPDPSAPETVTVDGITYTWSGTQISGRSWQIESQSETPAGVSRRLVATIQEQPLFFPGAFGDLLIGLNGTSTEVDSYNSDPACTPNPGPTCGWGTDPDFGTVNGTIGTNEDFDFSGNTDIRPGGALLYDWADNPATGITPTDPFGSRCDGNPCTTTYVSTVDERLDFASPEQMEFITDKFDPGGACDGASARQMDDWTLGAKNKLTTLRSYYTAQGGMGTPAVNDPTSDSFDNFYCADSFEILGDIQLDSTVASDNPVVVFVKDYLTAPDSGSLIACHDSTVTWCDSGNPRNITPAASRFQIFVAGIPSSGPTAGDISFKSQVMFAGVVYAPRSRCGGNGGIDVYGAIMCGTMDQVGNWDFHYDDALGTTGTGFFNVAFWEERAPTP